MRPKNTLFPIATLLQSRGRLLSVARPQVMGILNLTPDSFFKGSRMSGEKQLLHTAEAMLHAGAAILDVGGASTRPGAQLPGSLTELKRILPAIETLAAHFPEAWLSVDTVHTSVAEAAVEAGAAIVNDISGGTLDAYMPSIVARLGVPYIAMHMQGIPQTMQQSPQYENVVLEVYDLLRERLQAARQAGIQDVILDVGFGFGKTLAHNYALLHELDGFRSLGCPVLAGISRKGMVWKALNNTPEAALNGTTAVHMLALQNGASILRAHDVPEAMEAIKIWEQYESAAA